MPGNMDDTNMLGEHRIASATRFLPESLLLRELSRRGLGLRFAPALETAFNSFLSRFFVTQSRLACAGAIVLLIGMQTATVVLDDVPQTVATLQAVLLLAVLAPVLLFAVYWLRGERGARRLHSTTLVVVAVTTGIALALPTLYMQHGAMYPFRFSEFLLVFVFLLSGLPFRSAVRVGVIILLLEAARVAALGLPTQEWMHFLVLSSFAVVGTAACYLQARAVRRHFLTEQLYFGRSVQDALTRIMNRRGWDEAADKAWSQARRDGCEVGLAVIDIDHFKQYNDTHGHPAGDDVLREVAHCLSTNVARRPFDQLARLGGEEFGVLWYNTPGALVDRLAERVRKSIEDLGIEHPNGGPLTVSVGYTHLVPSAGVSVDDAYALADAALYAAKLAGRNAVRTTSATLLSAAKAANVEPDSTSNKEVTV